MDETGGAGDGVRGGFNLVWVVVPVETAEVVRFRGGVISKSSTIGVERSVVAPGTGADDDDDEDEDGEASAQSLV